MGQGEWNKIIEDEVSDTNKRVQSWLIKHVYNNPSTYKSMLNMNSLLPTITTSTNSSDKSIKKNNLTRKFNKYKRRQSDVDRYLTQVYNLNSNTLEINKYASMQNLTNIGKGKTSNILVNERKYAKTTYTTSEFSYDLDDIDMMLDYENVERDEEISNDQSPVISGSKLIGYIDVNNDSKDKLANNRKTKKNSQVNLDKIEKINTDMKKTNAVEHINTDEKQENKNTESKSSSESEEDEEQEEESDSEDDLNKLNVKKEGEIEEEEEKKSESYGSEDEFLEYKLEQGQILVQQSLLATNEDEKLSEYSSDSYESTEAVSERSSAIIDKSIANNNLIKFIDETSNDDEHSSKKGKLIQLETNVTDNKILMKSDKRDNNKIEIEPNNIDRKKLDEKKLKNQFKKQDDTTVKKKREQAIRETETHNNEDNSTDKKEIKNVKNINQSNNTKKSKTSENEKIEKNTVNLISSPDLNSYENEENLINSETKITEDPVVNAEDDNYQIKKESKQRKEKKNAVSTQKEATSDKLKTNLQNNTNKTKPLINSRIPIPTNNSTKIKNKAKDVYNNKNTDVTLVTEENDQKAKLVEVEVTKENKTENDVILQESIIDKVEFNENEEATNRDNTNNEINYPVESYNDSINISNVIEDNMKISTLNNEELVCDEIEISPSNNISVNPVIDFEQIIEANENEVNERSEESSSVEEMKQISKIIRRKQRKGMKDSKTELKENENSETNNSNSKTPVTVLKIPKSISDEQNLSAYSENISDIDVSPLPTDSDKESSYHSEISELPDNLITQNSIDHISSADNSNRNSINMDEFPELIKKREDVFNLIKESLSNDLVLDRIVSTLFANVLNIQQTIGEPSNSVSSESDFMENQLNITELNTKDTYTVVINGKKIDDAEVSDSVEADVTVNVKLPSRKPENKDKIEFEREVRKYLAEGLVSSYEQGELAVKLMELKFDKEDCLTAAKECRNVQMAVAYLQQECHLCAGKCSMKQMFSMLECEHRCCTECALNYFTLQVTEKSISDCVCPFCKMPDLTHTESDKAQQYFSHLDILLKRLLKEKTHELFQRKLRDWTLMQDPNFKWCIKCSSGFISDPRQKRLMCPDCKSITCAKCRRSWDKQHEGKTCEEFGEWLEYNDPENQLARHMAENGVTCPKCKTRYSLARGGCMHLTCSTCKYEFCSGCSRPFLMGDKCQISSYCVKLGLHSHHPRNCLFYLRDKDPEILEKLLKDNGVECKRPENDEKSVRCTVQLLKETPDGLLDAICGYPIEAYDLCRKHLVEFLSRLIQIKGLETIHILGWESLETVVRHAGKIPPPNPYGTPIEVYEKRLIEMIKEEIPLE